MLLGPGQDLFSDLTTSLHHTDIRQIMFAQQSADQDYAAGLGPQVFRYASIAFPLAQESLAGIVGSHRIDAALLCPEEKTRLA